ncbi:ATP-binding cassette domain-containing protein [Arcanobacterium phocae]|uniref:ABC-type quaternary amine transporter n=1 Tax=Arcanobacterium phocae TaxID=131112 RepID=A0A1H2LJ37_9ACTO|nr:ABC transporter ATP-binding protein [Arcanobacterium phocae]SDU80406.1 osmoprotectant transport system ATP-binding protein [Arcanobacterium phocae]
MTAQPSNEGNEIIISFDDVKKSYGDKTIIESLSLTVKRGEFLTILGESGSGKSTLLKMINGLVTPDSGTIMVAGTKVATPAPDTTELVKLRRRIGYAVQGSILFPHLSVAQNIGYVPKISGASKEEIKADIERASKIAGLDAELLDRMPDQLSGGQAQRVGIARSIAGRPELLLMDEPFGAVDEITRRALQDEIVDIVQREGLTCLFVTHDTTEALKLGSKVLVLKDGDIEQYDTPDQIANHGATEYVRTLINHQPA